MKLLPLVTLSLGKYFNKQVKGSMKMQNSTIRSYDEFGQRGTVCDKAMLMNQQLHLELGVYSKFQLFI